MYKKRVSKKEVSIDPHMQIDYKDYKLLKSFMSPQAKIVAKKRTGHIASSQRKLTQAIKRARFLAIVPFITR